MKNTMNETMEEIKGENVFENLNEKIEEEYKNYIGSLKEEGLKLRENAYELHMKTEIVQYAARVFNEENKSKFHPEFAKSLSSEENTLNYIYEELSKIMGKNSTKKKLHSIIQCLEEDNKQENRINSLKKEIEYTKSKITELEDMLGNI